MTTVRTRSRIHNDYFREVGTSYLGDPVSSIVPYNGSFDKIFTDTVTADYPDRNWRYLIANGYNATTLLSGSREGYTGTPHLFGGKEIFESPSFSHVASPHHAEMRLHHPSDPVHNKGYYVLDSYSPGYWALSDLMTKDLVSFHNDIDLQAKQRFINNVVKVQKKFDSLVFGGELHESLSLILSPGRALRKALDGHIAGFLKKGAPRSFPSARKVRQYVQGKWLEFVFGVRPLLADIHDGAEAIASSIVDRVPNRKATSSAKGVIFDSVDGKMFDRNLVGIPFGFRYGRMSIAYGYYVKYFGCVYNPNWENGLTASSLGIDWRNVAPAIYELIPYSFLVDYFLNLGGLINYFSYGTANIRWVARSAISHNESYWSSVQIVPAGTGDNIIDSFHATPGSYTPYFIRRSVFRDNYEGTLFPGIQFGLPNLPQWLNIAALIDSSDKVYRGLLKGVRIS